MKVSKMKGKSALRNRRKQVSITNSLQDEKEETYRRNTNLLASSFPTTRHPLKFRRSAMNGGRPSAAQLSKSAHKVKLRQ